MRSIRKNMLGMVLFIVCTIDVSRWDKNWTKLHDFFSTVLNLRWEIRTIQKKPVKKSRWYTWTKLNTENSQISPRSRDLHFKIIFLSFLTFQPPSPTWGRCVAFEKICWAWCCSSFVPLLCGGGTRIEPSSMTFFLRCWTWNERLKRSKKSL